MPKKITKFREMNKEELKFYEPVRFRRLEEK